MLPAAICDRARLARDRRFDGRFFSGVVTTRIYCRPVCPVRPARSENVRFFPSAAAAELAGFRPCLRCRPEAAPGSPAWNGSSATVGRGLALIERGFLDGHDLAELSAVLGMGPRHLTRLFVQHCGAAPGAVARTRRIQVAKRLLDETPLHVTDVALAAGFASVRRFNSAFRATYRRSPSEVRRRPPAGATEAAGAIRVRLCYRPPYDWPAMLRFLSAEAAPGVECVSGDEYRRTIALGSARGWLGVRPARGAHALDVVLHLSEHTRLRSAIDRLHTLFDLRADPVSIRRALVPLLARRHGPWPGVRLPGAWDGFEIAVRTVVARTPGDPLGALIERFGERIDVERSSGLSRLFPSPEALSDASLSVCGLSARTAATVRRLASGVARGRIVLEPDVPFARLVESLVADAGLTRDAAEWIAMRTLGEPDADVAGWLRLDEGVRSWWRARGTQEAVRPWRSYAALALASGYPCRRTGRVRPGRSKRVPAGR
jgi:AraC family transcriptional regulator of adaptative response / DNA-3-methyladenine glycosylase II